MGVSMRLEYSPSRNETHGETQPHLVPQPDKKTCRSSPNIAGNDNSAFHTSNRSSTPPWRSRYFSEDLLYGLHSSCCPVGGVWSAWSSKCFFLWVGSICIIYVQILHNISYRQNLRYRICYYYTVVDDMDELDRHCPRCRICNCNVTWPASTAGFPFFSGERFLASGRTPRARN